MKIKNKLLLGYAVIVSITMLAGLYGLIATRQIINFFNEYGEHFREIITAATDVSSYAKRAEGHLLLYFTLQDKNDRDKFFERCASLESSAKMLDGMIQKEEPRLLVEKINSRYRDIFRYGSDLFREYDTDISWFSRFFPMNHKPLFDRFSVAVGEVRQLGIDLADMETDFLNKQEAITAANELSSSIKMSESSIMSFIVFGDKTKRDDFFRYHDLVQININRLIRRTTQPDSKTGLETIRAETGSFFNIGKTILQTYDREMQTSGAFHLVKHRDLIRMMNGSARTVRDAGIKLARYKTGLETDMRRDALSFAGKIQSGIVIAVIFSIVMSLVITLVLSKKIALPIVLLKEYVSRYSDGDTRDAPDIHSEDEIGVLAGEFRRMTEKLGSTMMSKRFVNNIIITMKDLLIVLNPDGTVRIANRAVSRLLGYGENELLGMHIKRIIRSGTGGIPARTEYSEPDKEEAVFIDRDGREISVSLSCSEMFDNGTDVSGIIYVAQDIRERKNYEEALRKAKERAEQASGAKNEFLARMSHEIRTPMNAIMGMTELVMDTELTGEQKSYLSAVYESSAHLLAILDEILSLSRIEAGKITLNPVDFHLRGFMNGIIILFKAQAEKKGLSLDLSIDDEVPEFLHGDNSRLQQIFINFIGNAIKFTPRGGIAVQAQRSGKGEMGDSKEMGSPVPLRFSIRDSGIGIPEDKLRKIFMSFEQVDTSYSREHGGVGLGLAINNQLIELMGGRVGVTSELNKGSEFYFEIPLLPGRGVVSVDTGVSASPRAVKMMNSKDARILIIEDNRVNIAFVSAALGKAGYSVTVASSGRDGISALAGGSYGLVLMDIEMPGMNGMETTELIRQGGAGALNKNVPILAMTAHVMEDVRKKCIDAGMDGFITKPVKVRLLREEIEKFILKPPPRGEGGQVIHD